MNYKLDEYIVSLYRTKYFEGNNLAVKMDYYDEDIEAELPFATLTVNIPGYSLNEDEAFVDTNNCECAEDFINDNNIGTFTGRYGHSGFCTYPIYKFDLSVMEV